MGGTPLLLPSSPHSLSLQLAPPPLLEASPETPSTLSLSAFTPHCAVYTPLQTSVMEGGARAAGFLSTHAAGGHAALSHEGGIARGKCLFGARGWVVVGGVWVARTRGPQRAAAITVTLQSCLPPTPHSAGALTEPGFKLWGKVARRRLWCGQVSRHGEIVPTGL